MGVYDAIRKCVAFVGFPTERGFAPDGTGFFVAVHDDGLTFGYLVTAAHVVAGGASVVRLNLKDGGSRTFSAPKNEWIFNSNPKIDICALPTTISPLDDDDPHEILFINIASTALRGDNFRRSGLSLGDSVFIAGLFAPRGGEKRNIPIVRMASVAALPEEPLWPQPTPAYLIETKSLGGTSGAPVFFDPTRSPLIRPVEPPIIGIGSQEGPTVRIVWMPYSFLGMVIGSHAGDYRTDFKGLGQSEFDIQFNAGISVVMTATDVLDFLEGDPSMKAQRQTEIEKKKADIGYRPSSASKGGAPSVNATDNHQHKEDFTSLLNAAAKTKEQDDQT